jgi:hypothetical protein
MLAARNDWFARTSRPGAPTPLLLAVCGMASPSSQRPSRCSLLPPPGSRQGINRVNFSYLATVSAARRKSTVG